MPLRERAKNLFKTKSRGSSISKTDSKESDRERYPSNVYKPGEPMPRPKYRAPPKKEHKEKLEAFNFADAWRKKSFQSSYSPMGTRAPSRRTSLLSLGKKSAGGRSIKSGGKSRTNSITSGETEKSGVRQREGLNTALAPRLTEQEGDDDVGNVGLSRVQSRENRAGSRPRSPENPQSNRVSDSLHQTSTITAHDHQPFTEQELNLAMQRTRTVQTES